MRKIDFISGEYDVIEAKDILSDMFHKNINFNKVRNFSSQIRFGKEDQNALKRIETLKESVECVNNILKEAHKNNKVLKIKSFIEIEYAD